MSTGADSLASRLAAVETVGRQPPLIHYMTPEDVERGEQTGVWSTDRSCYEFMASRCVAGSRTLETGSGVSTILFAAWGTHHVSVTPGPEEAEAIQAYCQAHHLPTDRLTFDLRSSDVALPDLGRDGLDRGGLDLVLIDGGHGFPTPMIDWYFGARHLRSGGVVVVDDLQLPAVRVLVDFLESDARWKRVAGTSKWAGFERLGAEDLLEDWYMQPFYAGGPPPTKLARMERRLRALALRGRRRFEVAVGRQPPGGRKP